MNTEKRGDPSDKSVAENQGSNVGDQTASETKGRKNGSQQQKRTESKQRTSYVASIYPSGDPHLPPIPPELGKAVLALQDIMGQPIWLLLQNGIGKYGDLNANVKDAFFFARSSLVEDCQNGKKIVLMI